MTIGHFIAKNVGPDTLVPALVSSIHQGIALMDADLNIQVFSRRAKEIFGLPESLFESDPNLADIIRFFGERGDYGPVDVDERVRSIIDLARSGEVTEFEGTFSKDRQVRIQVTELPCGGKVAVYSDVTCTREFELQLEQSQHRLEAVLNSRTRQLEESRDLLSSAVDAIPDALVMIDGHGLLTLANSNMKRLYPLIECHLDVRAHIAEVFPLEGGPVADVGAFLSQIARESDQRMFGRWFRIQVSSVPTGGYIVVFSDVTDFKTQNEKLRAHADQLVKHLRKEKRLSEMQRQFVSMASHEFRTPLAIIDGAAQRLKRRFETLEPEQVRVRLDHVRDAVGRINYLIERFIDFAVAQDGTLEIEPQPHRIVPVVEGVCAQLQRTHKSHHIRMTENVGDLVIGIDRRMIEQCLVNIVGNAIKYSEGKDLIEVNVETEGKYLSVSVRDFGVGIPKDEIKKIFGRFYRASTSSGIPGTGIGLNLTELIVVRHKGRISVESEVGNGTTITVRLPLESPQAKAADKHGAGASPAGTSVSTGDAKPAVA